MNDSYSFVTRNRKCLKMRKDDKESNVSHCPVCSLNKMAKLSVFVVLCHGLFLFSIRDSNGTRVKFECPPGCSSPNFIGGLVPPAGGMLPAGTIGPHSPHGPKLDPNPNAPLGPQGPQDMNSIIIGVLSGVIILLILVIIFLIHKGRTPSQVINKVTVIPV